MENEPNKEVNQKDAPVGIAENQTPESVQEKQSALPMAKDGDSEKIDTAAKKMEGENVTGSVEKENLSFEFALRAIKEGKKVARDGWNGKGMFVYLVPANSYPAQTETAKKEFGDMVPYGAYIAMKTTQGNVVPWLASQTDLLAEDWMIVE